jgi:hypothetical protein
MVHGAKHTYRLRGAFRIVRFARVVSISFDCLKKEFAPELGQRTPV